MKRAYLPIACTIGIALTGCTGEGVPQADYDAALDDTRKLQMQVEDLESQLADAKEEASTAVGTPTEKSGDSELEKQLDEQLKEFEAQQKELDQLKKEFSEYKSKYRLTVREKLIGKEVPKLATTKEVFEDVVVKDITAVGLRIMHSGGSGRIRFEDLAKELQDQLGYDKEEADAIIAQELAAKEAAKLAAAEARAAAAPEVEAKRQQMSVSAIENEIKRLDGWVRRATIQHQAIKREASSYAAKARYARSRGRVSYWGPKADEKKRVADALYAQIRAGRSKITELKSKVRAANRAAKYKK